MSLKIITTLFIWGVIAYGIFAQNIISQQPIIQTKFTADPAPMVYNDTVFLYTSHDEDDAEGFKMVDWLLYTSTDMVNWTDNGVVASLKNFSWAKQDNGAWAVQCIERDGKFYLYCPMHGGGIGVLVADNPYGPFVDPLGKRLIDSDHIWNDIDPSPFIDDNGQAYLFWGNPDLYYVKLNKDMISISGQIVKESTKPQNYQEGPWVWKQNGYYYLAYASTCCPEGIGYAMSNSPIGPWEYKGMIVEASELTRGNHPGLVEYKGNTYCFGHSYDLIKQVSSVFCERRSVDMDQLFFNEDGSIQSRHYWSIEGPDMFETLNPYKRIEAETIAWSRGLKTAGNSQTSIYVTKIDNGDYIKVRSVDFGKGAKSFDASVASISTDGSIEIRIDNKDGNLLGTLSVKSTGGDLNWKTQSCKLAKVKGVHDVYLVFKGGKGNLFNFDWWKLK